MEEVVLLLVPSPPVLLSLQDPRPGETSTEGTELTWKWGVKQQKTVSVPLRSWRVGAVTFCPDPSPSLGDKKENSHSSSLQVTPGLGCCSDSDELGNVLLSNNVLLQWSPFSKGPCMLSPGYHRAGVSSDIGVARNYWIHPDLWEGGGGITSQACPEKLWGGEFPQAPWELSSPLQ